MLYIKYFYLCMAVVFGISIKQLSKVGKSFWKKGQNRGDPQSADHFLKKPFFASFTNQLIILNWRQICFNEYLSFGLSFGFSFYCLFTL